MKERIKSGFFAEILKGAGIAFLFTFVFVAIFALVLRAATLSSLAVKAVNQFIKAISLFIGCFFSLRSEKGLIKGALAGLLWAALVYAAFALFGRGGFGAFAVIADFVFAAIIGGLSGIIAVNVKGR